MLFCCEFTHFSVNFLQAFIMLRCTKCTNMRSVCERIHCLKNSDCFLGKFSPLAEFFTHRLWQISSLKEESSLHSFDVSPWHFYRSSIFWIHILSFSNRLRKGSDPDKIGGRRASGCVCAPKNVAGIEMTWGFFNIFTYSSLWVKIQYQKFKLWKQEP